MIWLRSLLNPYVILGVAIACLFGLWKWEKRKTTAAKQETAAVRKSLDMAQNELLNASAVNQAAIDAVAATKAEAQRQAEIAAAAEKKSRDRLRENNLLRKDIQSVQENPPVPAVIELLLDAQRVRGADTGPGDGHADKNPDGEAASPRGPEVPGEANPAPETPIG